MKNVKHTTLPRSIWQDRREAEYLNLANNLTILGMQYVRDLDSSDPGVLVVEVRATKFAIRGIEFGGLFHVEESDLRADHYWLTRNDDAWSESEWGENLFPRYDF